MQPRHERIPYAGRTAARHRCLLLEGSVDIVPKRSGGDTCCPANGGPNGRTAANDGANGGPARRTNRSSTQGPLLLGRHVCTSDGGTEYKDE